MEAASKKIANELSVELDKEIEWREHEIAILKKTPLLKNITIKNRDILYKHSVPAFYALWEGFVSKAFEIYIGKLNNLNLTFKNIHPNIMTHDLYIKKGLENARTSLGKQVELTLDLMEYFEKNIVIASNIPTKSNVNFKVINNILERFNLEKLNKGEFEFKLNKLLKYRNDIAHGENSLKVDTEIINETSETSIKCMHKIRDLIEKGFEEKSYIR